MGVLNYAQLNSQIHLGMITGDNAWAWGLTAVVNHCPTSDAAVQAAPLDRRHPPHPCDWGPCLPLHLTNLTKAGPL